MYTCDILAAQLKILSVFSDNYSDKEHSVQVFMSNNFEGSDNFGLKDQLFCRFIQFVMPPDQNPKSL